jgi:small-conductance mechanosensitive channel
LTMEPSTAAAATVSKSASSSFRLLGIIPTDTLFGQLFTIDTVIKIARVAISLFLGLIFVGLVITILKKVTSKRMDVRTSGLIVKIAQYMGFAFILINALDAAQVNLSTLLGAAGIVGIALGFAAQTSVSNFISGFFIVSEKTFAQGDVINVEGTTGIVYSIDAMSVKLRTFDNQLIRLPNEMLIKSTVTNITRFPVRRLNIEFTVTYGTDIERIRAVLYEVVKECPNALRNPEPLFMVTGFKDSGVGLLLGVWFATGEWFDGNNYMYIAIKKRLEAEGIEFAYPSVSIYANPEGPRNASKAASGARVKRRL